MSRACGVKGFQFRLHRVRDFALRVRVTSPDGSTSGLGVHRFRRLQCLVFVIRLGL